MEGRHYEHGILKIFLSSLSHILFQIIHSGQNLIEYIKQEAFLFKAHPPEDQ